jgi:hypothetical protein
MSTATHSEKRPEGTPGFGAEEIDRVAEEHGVAMESFTYGEVPSGMRQHGPLRTLESGRLYEVRVFGPGVSTLEFYG